VQGIHEGVVASVLVEQVEQGEAHVRASAVAAGFVCGCSTPSAGPRKGLSADSGQ
jgi:hypothetical protein